MITYEWQGTFITSPIVERHYNHPEHGDGYVVRVEDGALRFTRWVTMAAVVTHGVLA